MKKTIFNLISVFLSHRPQPYRALKESDSADGEEAVSPEKAKKPLPPSPLLSSNTTEINLLEDIFPNLEVETQPQPLSQAKSLEDLRTPKEEGHQRCTFDYQVWTGFHMPWRNLHRTRAVCLRLFFENYFLNIGKISSLLSMCFEIHFRIKKLLKWASVIKQ